MRSEGFRMPQLGSVTAFGSINTRLGSGELARLDAIISVALRILISEAPGADEQIQEHLARCRYEDVVVYHNGLGPGGGPRRNLGGWTSVQVTGSFEDKDRRMCRDADAGLAFWNGSSRGTRRNIRQLRDEGKLVRVVLLAV
jgi:hypothetical protein